MLGHPLPRTDIDALHAALIIGLLYGLTFGWFVAIAMMDSENQECAMGAKNKSTREAK